MQIILKENRINLLEWKTEVKAWRMTYGLNDDDDELSWEKWGESESELLEHGRQNESC